MPGAWLSKDWRTWIALRYPLLPCFSMFPSLLSLSFFFSLFSPPLSFLLRGIRKVSEPAFSALERAIETAFLQSADNDSIVGEISENSTLLESFNFCATLG